MSAALCLKTVLLKEWNVMQKNAHTFDDYGNFMVVDSSNLLFRRARPGRLPSAVDSDLDFQVIAEKCRDCDGLKFCRGLKGFREQLSTNCAAYGRLAESAGESESTRRLLS